MEKQIKLEIEELEERIAPAVLVAIKPGGIDFCAPDQAAAGINAAASNTSNIFDVSTDPCGIAEG